MEGLDPFTEGSVKQNTLRTCINTNSVTSNDASDLDNSSSLRLFPSRGSGDAANEEHCNYSHDRLSSDICQNGNTVENDVEERNFASTTVSSPSDSSSTSGQVGQSREHEQSPEVEQAISVAGLLQHRADNEPLHRSDNPILDSNEEGYDSEDYKDGANDAKLLEFMLQNSQSQEDFHHQYDQLTSSLQEDSSDKILNETQGLSEIEVSTILDDVNYSNSVSDQSTQNEKQCWVCFASEEDDTTAMWTSPCR